MTIVYFDCFAGISGDMTLGALIDAGGDRALLDAAVESLRLGDEVSVEVRHETRGHVGGTRVVVQTLDRVGRTVPALRAVVEAADAPEQVKRPVLDAINLLSLAESRLHHMHEDELHLHELGGADTLVDLMGAFWLLHGMDVEQVYASALPAPRGRSGSMPLPAPASVRVLEGTGAVFEATQEDRELVTPTGAAILAAGARFERPAMSLRSVGYGIGTRESPGNVLAVWVGDRVEPSTGVTLIETNLDDMAPNLIAPLCEDLMSAGALDVTVTPTLMKKGRPGHLVSVLSPPELAGKLAEHLLRHSTTLGVRVTGAHRVTAQRRTIEVKTHLGTARVKVKEFGGKPVDASPEYEDCRLISLAKGIDLREVMRVVTEAARKELGLS
ncbi:MAG TPA: nickel pincer cofactor biosynthesis protein LarC [Candidatus Acidoferrum sp.]|nr:nickel pincer cofactor biosynthesis protein LarC [Candidatus Acidoferrum sp.]